MKSYNLNTRLPRRTQLEDEELVVSPELRYLITSQFIPLLICIAIPSILQYLSDPFIKVALYGIGILLLLYFIYVLYRTKKTTWTITDSQIIYRRGVFAISVDYMELYRVNDYTERMSFTDNLLGIKTITIHSSDRTNSTLSMFGIDKTIDVVSVLRTNVEHSKTLRNVYEIANR